MPPASTPFDAAHEMEKLARLISDELDKALIENKLVPADQCIPWDACTDQVKKAIREAASAIYNQLFYNTASGEIVVVPQRGLRV